MNNNKLLWWVGWTSRMTTTHQHPRTTWLVDKNQTGRQSERPAGPQFTLTWSRTSSNLKFGKRLDSQTIKYLLSQSTSKQLIIHQRCESNQQNWLRNSTVGKCSRPATHRLGRWSFKSQFRSEEVRNYCSEDSPTHVILLLATWFDSLTSITWLMSYNFIRRYRIVISLELQLMMLMELV
jgi:hypothetical protein